VLGVGNVLAGDDGLGPTVVRTLEATYAFPPGVALLDAGTPGFDLLALVAELDALIVVDVLRQPGTPGELCCYSRDELLSLPPQAGGNAHVPHLREVLLAAELRGCGPAHVELVGAIAGRIAPGTSLSPPLAAVLPRLVAEVVARLARIGIVTRERRERRAPDLFWQRSAQAIVAQPS